MWKSSLALEPLLYLDQVQTTVSHCDTRRDWLGASWLRESWLVEPQHVYISWRAWLHPIPGQLAFSGLNNVSYFIYVYITYITLVCMLLEEKEKSILGEAVGWNFPASLFANPATQERTHVSWLPRSWRLERPWLSTHLQRSEATYPRYSKL